MTRRTHSLLRLRRTLRTVAMPFVLIFALLFGNLAQAQDPTPPVPPSDAAAESAGDASSPRPAAAGRSTENPVFGDVNLDQQVDIVDIQTVTSHWGLTLADPGWNEIMDINRDGVIDIADIIGVAGVWNVVIIVPDTTNTLTAQTTQHLIDVSPDGSAYTFAQMTPELAAAAPGEVIVAGPSAAAPDGVLRLVSSVDVSGAGVILSTTPATLEDAIQQAAFSVRVPLNPPR